MTTRPNERDETGRALASTAAGPRNGRERILEAAERIFSEEGFAGCSLRAVARAAEVPLSLVTYHFADKLGLYRDVFRARAPEIVQQRLAGLAVADLEDNAHRRAELVLRALLVPMLGLRTTERGRRFAVLLAREVSDPSSGDRAILDELLGPVTRATLSRLIACFPDRSREDVLWAYGSAIGAMVYLLTGARRMVTATDGVVDPDDVQTAARRLVGIALASLRG